MALTASAPPGVQAKVISSLFLNDPVIVYQDLNIFISASPIRSLEVSNYGILAKKEKKISRYIGNDEVFHRLHHLLCWSVSCKSYTDNQVSYISGV